MVLLDESRGLLVPRDPIAACLTMLLSLSARDQQEISERSARDQRDITMQLKPVSEPAPPTSRWSSRTRRPDTLYCNGIWIAGGPLARGGQIQYIVTVY